MAPEAGRGTDDYVMIGGVQLPVLRRKEQLSGDLRLAVAAELRRWYEAGYSVRALATEMHRSYGSTHQLLEESGVEFRPRGGYQRRRAAESAGAVRAAGTRSAGSQPSDRSPALTSPADGADAPMTTLHAAATRRS